jgi:hypothetical protein
MIVRAVIPGALVALALTTSTLARADADAPHADTDAAHSRADALFTAAKQLRDAGLYEDACPKFVQTEQIEPGVGVMLYLADCYQHAGRTANAWAEFRKAEELAHERSDKRADVAKARADALEAKLAHVTIAVPEAAKHPGLEVMVDGTRILPDHYDTALPTDPGDHTVEITEPGQAARSVHLHVDDGASLNVQVFEPVAPPPPSAAAPALATEATPETAAGPGGNMRTYVGFGLLGGGTVSLAVGAGLLDLENRSITKGHKSSNAGTFSGVAFAIAGAAYASAVVLYLTAPKDPSTALTLSAVPVASGAGALLGGSF